MKSKSTAAIALAAFLLIVPWPASAKSKQCFAVFGGATTIEVNSPVTNSAALTGRIFGGLTSCAGLSAWPIVGSAFKSQSGAIEFAFRVMTVDDSGCGAVDWIVPLSGGPLSGTAQFRNDHNDSTGSTTMTQVACPNPLPSTREFDASPMTGPDPEGNAAQ
jgi:hypothetical protein